MFSQVFNLISGWLKSSDDSLVLSKAQLRKEFELQTRKRILTVEGNIASGKSTVVDALREKYRDDPRVAVLLEPLSIWQSIKDDDGVDMITKFYGDIPGYSFAFQMMAYISRLTMVREALKNPDVRLIITERSLFTDRHVFAKMLHDKGLMEGVEHQIYMKWFDHFASELPLHEIIYIRTDPEVAHLRLKRRAREGEAVALDYLRDVHTYHEEWLWPCDRTSKTDPTDATDISSQGGVTERTQNESSWQVMIVDGNVDKDSMDSPASVVDLHVETILSAIQYLGN